MNKHGKLFSATYILLIVILCISFALRGYGLKSVPPSPSLDEVSIGYNAYSILKTGRDEYGSFMPILLRAYDDWRPALYVYLAIPTIALLGLTATAVRLPSVIMGMLSVLLIFITARDMFRLFWESKKGVNPEKGMTGDCVGLAAAFFLAVSPWSLYLSRLGHEANLGFFLTLSFICFFVRYLVTDKAFWLYPAAGVFGLSFNSYQSQKILMPLIAVYLVAAWGRIIWEKRRLFLGPAIFCMVVAAPSLYVSLSPVGLSRFQATSVLRENQDMREAREKYAQAKTSGDVAGILAYNRFIAAGKVITANYVKHFNPAWLFTGKLKEDHKIPYTGLLFPLDTVFVLLGLVAAAKHRRFLFFLLYLVLVSQIPGALTTQAPHAMRTMTSIIPYAVLGGLSMAPVMSFRRNVRPYYVLVIVLVIYGVLYLPGEVRNYFSVFPHFHAKSFQTAVSAALPEVIAQQSSVDKLVLSNEGNLYQSYMFYLYGSAKDPVVYQKSGGTISGGWEATHTIDNIEFRHIDWKKDKDLKNTLFVGNPEDFRDSVAAEKKYAYPDGTDGVWLVQAK